MSPPPNATQPFELSLEPLDTPAVKPSDADASLAAPVDYVVHDYAEPVRAAPPPPRAPAGKTPDRYLAKATQELRDGAVDQRLWARVLLMAGNDESAARAAYVRGRATMLRLAARDQQADPLRPAGDDAAPAPARDVPARKRPTTWRPTVRHLSIGAAAIGFVAALLWLTLDRQADGAAKPAESTPARAQVAQASAQPAEAARIAEAAAAQEITAGLEARVNALEAAGNWNVMALHATEWTRKQPNNALAWSRLGEAYMNLRQYPEAQDATMKATELAPSASAYWRSLGLVRIAMEQPDEAAQAFAKAAALEPRDIRNLVQLGLLNAQQKRLPEARTWFERALAVDPEDAAALCGQATVAQQQGRGRDADEIRSRVKAQDRTCDAGQSVGVRLAASAPKLAPAAKR